MMNGLFAPPDMSVMYPQGHPQIQVPQGMPYGMPPQMPQSVQASMDPNSPYRQPAPPSEHPSVGNPVSGQRHASYTGDPLVDKYIQAFIGQA